MKKQFYRNFQVFSGNTDSEAVVYNKLPSSIKARFIRLLPTQWRNQISMRIEVYGCPGNKLTMIEKIGLFYNRVDTFFLLKHSPLGNSLYLFSLCQALGQCRQTKKRASSEIATERKMAGREKGKQPVSIFTNITVCPLPRSLHEKSFLVLKDRSSFVA